MVFIEFFIGHRITGQQLYEDLSIKRVRVDGKRGKVEERYYHADAKIGKITEVVISHNRSHEQISIASKRRLRRVGILY